MDCVPLKWVADNIAPSAYAWAKKQRLKTRTIEGVKCVLKRTADKLAADLERTCSLAEVSRLTGIPKGSMRYYIDQLQLLKTIEVAKHERVLLSSIKPTKKYVAGHDERVRERNRQAALSAQARKRMVKDSTELVVYCGRNLAEREQIGTKKLVSCEEAARVSGKSVDYWREMCNAGTIRCERIGRQVFPFRHAVEIYLARK